jgi:hypothetical protein
MKKIEQVVLRFAHRQLNANEKEINNEGQQIEYP